MITMSSEITISLDGTINLSVPFEPETIAMLRKWKTIMETKDVPIESTINSLLKDLMIDKLSKSTGFKKETTLEKFGIDGKR